MPSVRPDVQQRVHLPLELGVFGELLGDLFQGARFSGEPFPAEVDIAVGARSERVVEIDFVRGEEGASTLLGGHASGRDGALEAQIVIGYQAGVVARGGGVLALRGGGCGHEIPERRLMIGPCCLVVASVAACLVGFLAAGIVFGALFAMTFARDCNQ